MGDQSEQEQYYANLNAQEEEKRKKAEETKKFTMWGCGGLVGLVLLVSACTVIFSFASEEESSAESPMDQWEIEKCGAEDYVYNVHYLTYGEADVWNEGGRFGWSNESTQQSTFPKRYYYTVSNKNAFGTETLTEITSVWDYQCNLMGEDSRSWFE